jgi:hypothetical protein
MGIEKFRDCEFGDFGIFKENSIERSTDSLLNLRGYDATNLRSLISPNFLLSQFHIYLSSQLLTFLTS